MRKYFIVNFYIHHKFAIIFNSSICSTILLTCSFLPTSLSSNNAGNSYQNINKKLGSYFYCILFILFFIILSYIYSFTRVYSKVFMQFKFISPFKIIIIYGIFGFIFCLIAFGISSCIPYQDNIKDYICNMNRIFKEENNYKFWVEIFCVYPLFSFISFMEIYFEILTICYLNPFYILMTNTIYYGITEAIYFLINLDPIYDNKILHFILTELAEIFCLLGLMIYLEILILNFCGLNEKVLVLIMKKGEEEFRKLSFIGTRSIINDDDDDEDDESNEVDNNINNNEDKTNNKDNKDEVETKTEIEKQYRNI